MPARASQQDLETRFVGRASERAAFAEARSAVLSGSPRILLVHGPPGVGKTTLLHAFEADALRHGFDVERLQADELGGAPAEIAKELAKRVRAGRGPSHGDGGHGLVVLIDRWERLRAFDDLAHAVLARTMAGGVVVVLAGREAPSPRVRASAVFGSNVVSLPLRALTCSESHELLARCGVTADRRASIVEFSHGHPLALALAVDAARQHPSAPEAFTEPSVIGALWEHFFETIPDDDAWSALEICALLRTTNEQSIAALAPERDARRGFAWLRGLSIVERTPNGVHLHDLARDLALRDLRWRSPARYVDLVRRAFRHLGERLQREGATLSGFIEYLHLCTTVAAPGIVVPASVKFAIDACDERAFEQARALIGAQDGEQEALLAEHWYARQKEAFVVVRDGSGELVGVLSNIRLDRASAGDRAADPVVARVWCWVEERLSGRPPGEVYLARFWWPRREDAAVRPVCGVLAAEPMLRSDRVSFVFGLFEATDLSDANSALAGISLAHELAYAGPRGPRVVAYFDRRGLTPVDFLLGFQERTLAMLAGGEVEPGPAPLTILALERDDFAASVRCVLRALGDRDRLARSPLVDSRMVIAAASPRASRDQRAEVLRDIVVAAIDALDGDAARLRAVLRATFLGPGVSQERAAESLRLPYGTYRRYLAHGIDRVVDRLWCQDGGESRA